MVDRYRDFASLAKEQVDGTDYRITLALQSSRVAVIAPHGGFIEPGTSELAAAVAGPTYSFYAFEGLVPNRKHSDLHITSTEFDEPVCCNLVARADVVVAMHGRADGVDSETIWLGGQDADLLVKFERYLRDAGFRSLVTSGALGGISKYNICNRSARGAGAQLELPRTLRDDLSNDYQRMSSFSEAIRAAIEERLQSIDE